LHLLYSVAYIIHIYIIYYSLNSVRNSIYPIWQ